MFLGAFLYLILMFITYSLIMTKNSYAFVSDQFFFVYQVAYRQLSLNFFYITAALLLVLLRCYHGCLGTVFFGHLLLTSVGLRYLAVALLFLIFLVYILKSWLLSSSNTFDFLYVLLLLYVTCGLLWFITSLFSLIFLFDLLNIILYLFFFLKVDRNVIKLNDKVYIYNYFGGFSVFFWTSFFATILFFLFLVYFYVTFYTFNFYVANVLFIVLFKNLSVVEQLRFFLLMSFFCFFFFIKVGFAPFFIWKLSFFQSLDKKVLCIYLFFYYTTVLLYFFYSFFNFFFYFTFVLKYLIYLMSLVSIIITVTKLTSVNDIHSFFIYSSLINTTLVSLVFGVACCSVGSIVGF